MRIFEFFKTEKTSVKKATYKVYGELPKEFSASQLCDRVRRKLRRKKPMDTTIMRRLRELRQEERINYVPIDVSKARYQKVA